MQNDEKLHLIQTREELSASSSDCWLSALPFLYKPHTACVALTTAAV